MYIKSHPSSPVVGFFSGRVAVACLTGGRRAVSLPAAGPSPAAGTANPAGGGRVRLRRRNLITSSVAEGARMTKAVRLVRDDTYEEMGAAYQCVLAAALDTALRESGVKSASTRRKVAESFLFAV